MQSLGGSRAVIALATKVLIVVALVAAVPLLYFQPFGARHHPTVEIHDEAGVPSQGNPGLVAARV